MVELTAEAGANLFRENRMHSVLRDFVRYTPSGDSIPEETWRGRHRNIVALLLAHVPFLFLLGVYHGKETFFSGATIPAFSLSRVLLG
ncbi:MAG: methyl-accepting chemotaxis protein, partial [Salinigranum sp.]